MANHPSNHIEVDTARLEDADAVASIYAHYVNERSATFDFEGWTRQQAESLIRCKRPEGFWVARQASTGSDQKAVIGWASARRFSARPGYDRSLESAVYVAPNACGLGAGKSLMNELIRCCAENQIHHLMAKIIASNQSSIHFHESLGFQIVGTQKEVGFVDGCWADVVIMQRLLPSV